MKSFFIFSLFACFVLSCSKDDSFANNNHLDMLFEDSLLTRVMEDTVPNLIIKEGIVSQKADTFRIERFGKTYAIVKLFDPQIVAQAEQDEAWGFFQFPYIFKNEYGQLVVTWSMRDDSYLAYGESGGGCRVSYNDGKTWDIPLNDFFCKERFRVDLNNGDVLQVFTPEAKNISEYDAFPKPVNAEPIKGTEFFLESEIPADLRGVYFDYWNHKTSQTTRFHASIDDSGLLRYSINDFMPIVWWGDIKELSDGAMVSGVDGVFYCNSDGIVLRPSVAFFKSTDMGHHWQGLGKIHYQDGRHDQYPYDGYEGFGEPTFEILSDNTYLCVMRVGSCHPMYRSFSKDEGLHWSIPEPFTSNGVRPSLLTLGNGILVMSSGRPGVQIRICLDGDGILWTEPIDMLPYMNENGDYDLYVTCGYTGIVQADKNSFYIVYSDFKSKNEKGENRKAIMCRKIEIIKKNIII